MALRIVEFTSDHLGAAAALLAARHRRDRDRLPLLPARFVHESASAAALAFAWARPGASGTAALDGKRMIGYLFADHSIDPLHGRIAWARLAGHAVAEGVDADLTRDLYAAAAPVWIEQEVFDHRVFVSAGDTDLERAWFRLGFGADQSYALLDLTGIDERGTDTRTDIEIRRATVKDRHLLERMSALIAHHQSQAPSWLPSSDEVFAELRLGFGELAGRDDATLWLAFRDPEPLGYLLFLPADSSADAMVVPEACTEVKVAATLPEARGSGVGVALTLHGLAVQRHAGYRVCLVDWHEPNLLSSRFWPKRGFVVAAQRLRRRVDERAAGSFGA